MKTIFQVEITSDLTVSPKEIVSAIRDLDLSSSNIKGIKVDIKESIITLAPRPMTFDDVLILAQKAGEIAVEEYLSKYPEPMYCGTAYLYRRVALPLKSRQRKVRYDKDKIKPTGFAGRTQSLDLQELWCNKAREVFNAHGIEVLETSWVD